MKRYLPLFFGLTVSFFGSAQTVNDYTLDLNNADARITDGGVFFNDEAAALPGFGIPSGSQLHTIFSMGFWYAGVDAGGQLKLSAQRYENLADQFKGPLSFDQALSPPPGSPALISSIYPITLDEIVFHQNNFMNAGYIIPQNIENWPAHGDVSLNQDFYLAPFVDVNGNGTYEPALGEYPCIRGDQAVYVIMNDKGGVHASGGGPLGIEMHYMFYEYLDPAEVDNTIFVSGKVINRGTQTLFDFKVSLFMDGDIGYSGDDYFGSDSTRNMMYFYNGDNLDESSASSLGYGAAPPAAGVISLTKEFESIGTVGATVNTAAEYWNLMNGMDVSGSPWMNPVTATPTSYMFASDPTSLVDNDSEHALSISPGERRGIATLDFDVLPYKGEFEFDFAVIYNRDNSTNNLQNASDLGNVADIVQNFFDNSITGDCWDTQNTLGLNEQDEVITSIHPNPSNGQLTLSVGGDFSNAEIKVYDISGRSVIETMKLISKTTNVEINQPAGVYLLHLIVDGHESIKRIILE